jgi:hypothetical protein
MTALSTSGTVNFTSPLFYNATTSDVVIANSTNVSALTLLATVGWSADSELF